MILCPYCGHKLPQILVEGISSCTNCRRCCDSTQENKLLSLAWVVRKFNITDTETLVNRYLVSKEDVEFVVKFVAEECLSHEEFFKEIKNIKIGGKSILT